MRTLGALLLLAAALSTQGCAIFVRGDLQDVTLQTQVPEVRLEVDGQVVRLSDVASTDTATPASQSAKVEWDRARVHVVRAEAPGYDPLEVTVFPQLNDDWMFAEQCTTWPLLWIPLGVDYNTGALYDFPETIDLVLRKSKDPAQAGGPSTTVEVAEVKEVRQTIRKPPRQPTCVTEARTARMLPE